MPKPKVLKEIDPKVPSVDFEIPASAPDDPGLLKAVAAFNELDELEQELVDAFSSSVMASPRSAGDKDAGVKSGKEAAGKAPPSLESLPDPEDFMTLITGKPPERATVVGLAPEARFVGVGDLGILFVDLAGLPIPKDFDAYVDRRRVEATQVTEAQILGLVKVPSGSDEWLKIRRFRCGASGVGALLNGRHPLTGEKWVADDQGGSFEEFVYQALYHKFKGNYATWRGHQFEPNAIEAARVWLVERHSDADVFIEEEGALVNADHNFLHATSDFIAIVRHKSDPSKHWAYNGEAKCPMSKKGYRGVVKNSHYCQMQQQMGTYMNRIHVLAAKHGVTLPPHWVMSTVYTVWSDEGRHSTIQIVDWNPDFYEAQCRLAEEAHREVFRRIILLELGLMKDPETRPPPPGVKDLEVDLEEEGEGGVMQEKAALEEKKKAGMKAVTHDTMALLGLL